jgi:hypothetical protein
MREPLVPAFNEAPAATPDAARAAMVAATIHTLSTSSAAAAARPQFREDPTRVWC